jgi:hypothetical protein
MYRKVTIACWSLAVWLSGSLAVRDNIEISGYAVMPLCRCAVVPLRLYALHQF